MLIRITPAILPYGSVQLVRGQVLEVSEELALAFAERGEASLVSFAEQATLPIPERATVPRTFLKPKPKPVQKGRR